METLKGYKTVAFFGLVILVALANLVGFADFQLTSDQQEFYNFIVPIAGIALRYFSTTEIFKSK